MIEFIRPTSLNSFQGSVKGFNFYLFIYFFKVKLLLKLKIKIKIDHIHRMCMQYANLNSKGTSIKHLKHDRAWSGCIPLSLTSSRTVKQISVPRLHKIITMDRLILLCNMATNYFQSVNKQRGLSSIIYVWVLAL